MTTSVFPRSRLNAGTFPSGPSAAGVFSTTHGKGDRGLTAARAVLAQVSNHTDLQIARACRIVLDTESSEPQERTDAQALFARLPMVVSAQVCGSVEGCSNA